ncbi:hypothetical protein AWC38_SpisGene4682 [Stylophora pistillata]|uniref:Uncharacterized protein n=1 Tax=Stylophora pistillata TaxID=50429 RepID=A0A2B4SPN1_STYPI|nr:hypothetical protein AWC38_SpisGene4682 [Stylophora pistillata]
MPERVRPFGTGLVRQCPQGLFCPYLKSTHSPWVSEDGLAESCSHIACVLYYLESWTKILGKLASIQMKCQWILPPFVKDVEYARVRDTNFKSELGENIENLVNDDCEQFDEEKKKSKIKDKSVPVPTQEDMDVLFSELSECKIKPVVLSLVQPYAESYLKSSRTCAVNTFFADNTRD